MLRKFLLVLILLTACTSPTPTPSVDPTSTTAPSPIPTGTPAPLTATVLPSPTADPSAPTALALTPTAAPTPFYEPAGCRQPSSDLSKVTINGFTLNRRTYEMLQYAAQLYQGEIDLTNTALTQGSYSNNGPASFGTHLGGGAVDISVIRPNSYTVLYAEIIPLITALRTAGFAAWLRDWNELAEGSGIHIHAVAVGDPELSPEAVEQLTGPAGYFRGFAGYLKPDGTPAPDHDGPPILCEWMVSAGYSDLRPESEQQPVPDDPNWMITLRETANSYITATNEESVQAARSLQYLSSGQEDPSLMCGPLAASLWQTAGLLPPGIGPWNDLHNYWLADPDIDGKPWSLFNGPDYRLYSFETPLAQFDFNAWPLRPGDFLYTYANENGFEHMFVVTEVDQAGRAYTVANQYRGEQVGYLIERLMLYDPLAPGEGVIYEEWTDRVLGRTGHDGFDVLRLEGLSQAPGELYEVHIRPGDTVYTLAEKYYSTPEAVTAANPQVDITRLEVGNWLWVPVNLSGWGSEVTPAQVPADAPETALQRHVQALVDAFPSGSWHVYIEDLSTGQTVSLDAQTSLHPASTIKLPIALAVFAYLDQHPEISPSSGLAGSTRSFQQLLEAMLIQSEEDATAELEAFLIDTASTGGLISSWGAADTSLEPRRSTASDLGLLWKRLFLGELLSPDATSALLSILRTPSRGDDERIGAGLPPDVRINLAHKTGTTFEMGPGVVADSGVVETSQGAYVIVVIGNQVEWVHFEQAKALIAEISSMAYYEFLGHP